MSDKSKAIEDLKKELDDLMKHGRKKKPDVSTEEWVVFLVFFPCLISCVGVGGLLFGLWGALAFFFPGLILSLLFSGKVAPWVDKGMKELEKNGKSS